MISYKNKISGNIYIVFLIIAIFWTALIANKGLDLSDVGYSMSNYKYFLQNASSMSIGMFLSNLLGGIIYNILPSHHVLVFKLLNVFVVGTSIFITFYIFKDYMSKTLLSIILMVVSFIRGGTSSIMSYTTISVMLLFISILFVYKSIVCQKYLYSFLAGLFIGISVFFRLPNILFASLYIVILWSDIINDKKKRIAKDTLYMILGGIVGLLLTASILIYYIGIDGIINSGGSYVSIASSKTNNHGIVYMIANIFMHFINGTRMHIFYGLLTSVFAIALFCVFRRNKTKGVRIFSRGSAIILLCTFVVALITTIFKYSQYSSVTLILASISIPVQLFSIFYFKKKQKMLSILSLITLCISFSISLGTDNGIYHQLYIIFWLFPYYIHIAQQLCVDIYNKIDSYEKGGIILSLVLSFFMVISINTFTNVAVNSIRMINGIQYREQETRKLRYYPRAAELKGVATSKSQCIFLDGVNDFFDDGKYDMFPVLAVNDIPMVFSIIDNDNALDRSYWLDLRSVPISRIEDALERCDDNNEYPIVIVKYFTYSDKPFSISDKAKLIQEFCEKRNYIEEKSGTYNNEKLYSIFIPNDKS